VTLGTAAGRRPRGSRSPSLAVPHAPGARCALRPRVGKRLGRVLVLLPGLILLALVPGFAASEEAAPQAGLVIRFDDGRIKTRCLAIEAEGSTGVDLLAQSGLEIIMDASSGMGITVCQIEGLGCPYPAKPCFCQCMSGSECGYWNYYYREPGQPDWIYSPLGARLRKLQPGAVEAWVWGDGHTPPPDELSFEAICGSPAVTPQPAVGSGEGQFPELTPPASTAQPPAPLTAASTAGPSAVTVPSETPTAPDRVGAAQPEPRATSGGSVAADPSLSSYWPFGLMVLALAAVGIVLWRRRTGGA
jgi:hypothetical protein